MTSARAGSGRPLQLRIGTSGWHYKHWIGRYYPEDIKPAQMLDYYLRDFDTVELNNTFYHLPKETSFQSWKRSVPSGFLFAVKGSRFITHMIKLKDPDRGIWNFIPRAQLLGRKLGPVLWQLPPGWKVNVERLDEFLHKLPNRVRYAFELRNPTWMTDAVLEVLRKHNAAFCIYELAGYQSPLELTADWTYIRLHGPTQFKYQGSYSNAQLAAWARRIDDWSGRLDAAYVYFDNDDSAYAVNNALTLKDMWSGGLQPAGRLKAAATPRRAPSA